MGPLSPFYKGHQAVELYQRRSWEKQAYLSSEKQLPLAGAARGQGPGQYEETAHLPRLNSWPPGLGA